MDEAFAPFRLILPLRFRKESSCSAWLLSSFLRQQCQFFTEQGLAHNTFLQRPRMTITRNLSKTESTKNWSNCLCFKQCRHRHATVLLPRDMISKEPLLAFPRLSGPGLDKTAARPRQLRPVFVYLLKFVFGVAVAVLSRNNLRSSHVILWVNTFKHVHRVVQSWFWYWKWCQFKEL